MEELHHSQPSPLPFEAKTPDLLNGFSALPLDARLLKSLELSGYQQPTPIQNACIPLLLEGKDVLGLAQTGSGKTAAFCLPGLQSIDLSKKTVQMLILAPTRELAIQVTEALNHYAQCLPGFKAVTIYGGQRYELQVRALKQGPQALVGTPGRMLDLLNSGCINLSHVGFLVLDEADEMLRMGFIEPITEILSKVPESRQTALFSATMPEPIRKISRRFMKSPQEVKVENPCRACTHVTQSYCVVAPHHKNVALVRCLEAKDFDAAIVFVRTKTATLSVTQALEKSGYRAAALNGDMTQMIREQTLAQLKSKAIDVLVATDVAARGLDVESLGWVINYDVPLDSETYVHRVGRTGRAGRAGEALLFIEPNKLYLLRRLERDLKLKLQEIEVPKVQQLRERRLLQWKQRLQATLQATDLESTYAPVLKSLSKSLGEEVSWERLSLALFRLAHKHHPIVVPGEVDETIPQAEKGQKRSSFESKASMPRLGREGFADRRRAAPRPPFAKPSHPRTSTAAMATYCIQMGRKDGLEARHLVGALIHEGGLSSQSIGNIKLFPDATHLEIASNVRPTTIQHLSKIRIFNQPLALSPLQA